MEKIFTFVPPLCVIKDFWNVLVRPAQTRYDFWHIPKVGACGLLQRTGLRPARLQAEKNVFPGKAGKNMI